MEIDCSTVIVGINRPLQLTEAMTDHLKVQFLIGDEVMFETVEETQFFVFD